MIKDKLVNAKTYYNLSENLKIGFKWLESNNLNNIEDGRYEISDKVYASVQSYETKEDALYESHRKYADIQYMINGAEKIGVSDLESCETEIAYDSEKDIEFFTMNKEEEYLELSEGQFVILYPQDAHKPSISKGSKRFVKKVVVKVAID